MDIMLSILNGIFKFIIKYPFLTLALIGAFIIACLMLSIQKDYNAGDLFKKVFSMFGLESDHKPSKIAENRDVAIGEADKKGYVQIQVDKLESSLNPFRDKTVIILPNNQKVKLPEGLTDKDVDTIIVTDIDIQIIPKFHIKPQENTDELARQLLNKLKDQK